MAKTKISEFSSTPGNNTDIDGINIAEGCAPSGINDAIRELMAQLKDFQAGDAGDSITVVGTLAAKGTSSSGADLKLYEDTDNGTNYVGFIAPASIASNIQWTLPSADGSSGQALQTNGSGTLSFATLGISAGGTGQTTANAAFNALAPSQTSNAGRYLKTDGTNTSWDLLDISTADITGTLPVANGGTGLTSFTANGVVYASSSSALTTGSALTFDGTSLGIGGVGTSDGRAVFYEATAGSGAAFYSSGGNSAGVIGTTNEASTSNGLLINAFRSGGKIAFNVAGSEQMRLTSTGLGIGTSSPSHRLVVSQSETTAYAASSGSVVEPAGGANTQILNTGSGGFASLRFASLSGSYAQGYLAFVNNGGSALGYFAFGQRSGSGYAEQMRLDSSGNLGLGVTPSAWNTAGGFKALQVGNGSLSSNAATTVYVSSNFVSTSTGDKYISTGAAAVYAQNAGAHAWYSAASGTAGNAISFTQAMTLDASGNLGVGTTSPLARLDVVSASQNLSRVRSSGANEAVFLFQNSNTGTNAVDGLYLGIVAAMDAYLWNYENNPIIFGTNNAERARITSDGNLGVGESNPSTARLFVTSDGSVLDNVYVKNTNTSAGTNNSVVFVRGSNTVGTITTTLSATAYNTSSDYRLKNITGPVTGSGEFIDALKPKVGTWKADGSKFVGFIAHEVQEVSPGSVVGTKDAVDEEGKPIMQAMEYGSAEFIANIIAELQSLRARVAQLEAK